MRLKTKGSPNIKNMLVFALNSPILLRCFSTTGLMNYSFGSIKCIKFKFRTIVTVNEFYLGFKVDFNKSYKILQFAKHFKF